MSVTLIFAGVAIFFRVAARLVPQTLGCQPRAFSQGFKLRPYDAWVNLGAVGCLRGEAAVSAGDDVLGTHEPCKSHQAFGNPLGMLNDVAGVCDDAWYQNFPIGQLDSFPEVILML